MYGYIYKITNLINDKVYIGQKKGPFKPTYLGSGTLIKRAIQKHGRDNFKSTLLVSAATKSELDSLEIHHIKEYKLTHDTYNILTTCYGNPGFGKKHTEETLQKMRLSHAKKREFYVACTKQQWAKRTLKERELVATKISNSVKKNPARYYWTGKKRSEETKRKISRSEKGKQLSEEQRRNIGLGHRGLKYRTLTTVNIDRT